MSRSEIDGLRAHVATLEQLLEVHERTTLEQSERAERAHAVVEAERARLREVFRDAPALVAVTQGPNHVYELVNPPYLAVVGKTEEEVLGRPLREALPEVAEQGFAALLDGVRASGEPYVGSEVRALRTIHGKRVEGFFDFVYQPLRGPDGEVEAVLTHAVEVTEQVRAREELEAQAVELEAQAAELEAQTASLEETQSELEAANRDLRQQETLFRSLADSIPQLAWMADETGAIFWYNRRWYEYTGTAPEQMEGWGWQSVHDPVALPQVLERWTASIRTGEPFDMVFPLRGADGVFRPFLTRVLPVRDAGGRIVRWFGTNTDVTEQQEAQERQRLLAEASSALAASLDYDATLRRVARLAVPTLADWCALDLLGEDGRIRRVAVAHPDPAKERIARELERRFPPDPDAPTGVPHVLRTGEPELVPDIPDELLEGAARSPEHLRLLRELELRSYIITPLTARGRTLGALTLVQAESGRRFGPAELEFARELAGRAAIAVDNARLYGDAQQALAEASALVAQRNAILGQTTDGVIVTDARGRITFVNQAAAGLHGVERLDVAPEDYSESYNLLTLEGDPYPAEELPLARAVLRDETVADALWRIRRPDGSEIVAQGSAAPVRAEDGSKLGAVLTLRDVTGQRRAYAERERLIRTLERTNAELDQFAYVASHDLKAPLRGIANLAEWIGDDLEPVLTPDTREQLALLQDRVRRMEALIDGILRFSRAGRADGEAEPVAVGGLLEEIVGLLAPPADTEIRLPLAAPTLVTQRLPLQQVLMNLLGNAFKYGRPAAGAPRVKVEVREGDEGAWGFAIADNGPGIPADGQERIWGIFQTLGARDGVDGTGIGLSLVKKLVEGRGGSVRVDSAPGEGTTFHFTWPVRAQERE